VKKDKDGKEAEGPVAIDVPADKTVDLSSGEVWLRVTKINTKPADMAVLPLSLYFRHSPNANLKIAMGEGGKGLGSAIEGWFSK
jgi:hypothetical protein